MMSKGVTLPEGKIPRSLPIYVRANYTYPNGMRPIVKIQMVFNETERISEEERKSNLNMICKKWWMAVVLNRNYDHERQYQNISDTMIAEHINNKCADYKMLTESQVKGLSAGDAKVDVNDTSGKKGQSDGDSNSSGSKNDPLGGQSPEDLGGVRGLLNKLKRRGAAGNGCFTELHIILNRRGENNIGDYLHSGCLDPTVQFKGNTTKPIESQGQVSFAQSGIHEILRDSSAREFMNGQQLMNPLP